MSNDFVNGRMDITLRDDFLSHDYDRVLLTMQNKNQVVVVVLANCYGDKGIISRV
jgi:hypothetical protein